MRFEWKIALRFLRESRVQTIFILAGIAIGVSVQIFLSSLIISLQDNLVESTVGSSSHITFSSKQNDFEDIIEQSNDGFIENSPESKKGELGDWRNLTILLRESGMLKAVSPIVESSAFLASGQSNTPVIIKGVDPNEADKIYNISSRLESGSLDINGNEVLIGVELQKTYKLDVGSFIKLVLPTGKSESLLVKGVLDLENKLVNNSWLIIDIDRGQKLISKTDSVTRIESQIEDVFAADSVGAYFEDRLQDIEITNWKDENASLLSALNSQGSSSLTIQVFVLLAILLGISSVLGISVVQKSREIGILKAMGARDISASRIFLMQGAALGFIGSILGCALGFALTMTFNKFAGASFSIIIRLVNLVSIIAITTGASFLSALVPSLKSKKLNPIEVIRNG